MKKKRVLILIVLFLFLGLGVVVFANPSSSTLEDEIETEEVINVTTTKKRTTTTRTTTTTTTTTTTKKVDNNQNRKIVVNANANNNTNINNKTNTQNNKNNEVVKTDSKEDNKVIDAGTIIIDNSSDNAQTSNSNNAEEDYNKLLEKALKAVEKAEQSFLQNDVDKALELIYNLKDSSEKVNLQDRISNVTKIINIEKLINELISYVNNASSKNDIENARVFNTSNEIIKKVDNLSTSMKKSELSNKISNIMPVLNDVTSPLIKVNDVIIESESSVYETNATIEVDDSTASITINGNKISTITELNNIIKESGKYELTVSDNAYNETKINIIIDNIKPVFNIKSGLNVNHDIEAQVTDDNFDRIIMTRTHQDENNTYKVLENVVITDKNFTLKEEGTYTLIAYDKSGNKTNPIYVAIDKTAPRIKSDELVKDKEVYDTDIKITIYDKFLKQGSVMINGTKVPTTDDNFQLLGKNSEVFKFERTFTQSGTYEIVVKDKAGNKKTITFTIDKND